MSRPEQPETGLPISVRPRRLIGAWAIDFAVLVVVMTGIAWATYSLIVDSLRSITDIGTIGVSNLISSQGDWLQTGTDAGMDVLRTVRFYAAGGLVSVLLVAAAYYCLSTALTNRTLGMAVADVRLGRAADLSKRLGWAHSLIWSVLRAGTDIGIFAAACVATMFGAFGLALVLWLVSVTWLLTNGVAAVRTGRSVVDRLTGMVVTPTAGYATAARIARGAAGSAAAQALNVREQAQGMAGQLRASSPELVQQTCAVAGQVGRQAVDRTRQAMESDRAAQAADASRRAASAGRRFAGDMKRRFDDRRG